MKTKLGTYLASSAGAAALMAVLLPSLALAQTTGSTSTGTSTLAPGTTNSNTSTMPNASDSQNNYLNNTDSTTATGTGEVSGNNTSQTPSGGVRAGAGGTTNSAYLLLAFAALAAGATGLVLTRRLKRQ